MTNIELIKSKLDIVEVISSYVPELKRAGANYKANCPFHSEKSPSFMVNPSLQIYKCFGCGKGGDVINFIQEFLRVDFQEALKVSAERAGVELKDEFSNPKDKKLEAEKKLLLEANLATTKFYHYILTTHSLGKSGREYAKKRGIDAKRIKDFEMGYAPASKDNLKKFLLKKGFSEKDLVRWGLLVERNINGVNKTIDKFRNRLIHPIQNIKGETIGFSGRYIGDNKLAPKYLNSPETVVFKKNENLYGIFQAKESMRKEDFVIVEEGNIDILSSHRSGIPNIVAPLGTAFTENQAKLLKRYVDQVYFCFDTDSAGLSALIKSVGIVENLEIQHKVIDIRPYKDPDEMIMESPEKWVEKVKNPVNTFDYLLDVLQSDLDINQADDKISFSKRIFPILRLIKNEITLSHYIKEVSILLEISEASVASELKKEKSVISKTNNVDSEIQVNLDFQPTSNEFKLQSYFLSLYLNLDKEKRIEINSEYISDQTLKVIAERAIKSEESDPAAIYDDLDEFQKRIFEEIMMLDISKVEKIELEIKKLYWMIKEKYLKSEIMKLRKQLSMSSDHKLLEKFQELVSELKNLK